MGKFNELLASRFNEGLTALLGLSEQEGVRTVSPEIMPVVMAEGERIEHSFLKQERKCIGSHSAAADAANFTYLQLANPAGSNVILVLEKVIFHASLAGSVFFGTTTNLFGTAAGAGVRDSRWGTPAVPQQPTGSLRNGINASGALIGGALGRIVVAASVSQVLDLEFVISPGYQFSFVPAAINTQMVATYLWRERAMLPEEQPS